MHALLLKTWQKSITTLKRIWEPLILCFLIKGYTKCSSFKNVKNVSPHYTRKVHVHGSQGRLSSRNTFARFKVPFWKITWSREVFHKCFTWCGTNYQIQFIAFCKYIAFSKFKNEVKKLFKRTKDVRLLLQFSLSLLLLSLSLLLLPLWFIILCYWLLLLLSLSVKLSLSLSRLLTVIAIFCYRYYSSYSSAVLCSPTL